MRGTETGSLSTIEEDTGNIDVEYTDSTVAAETTYYYAVLALSAGRRRGAVHHRERHHASRGTASSISPHRSHHLGSGP